MWRRKIQFEGQNPSCRQKFQFADEKRVFQFGVKSSPIPGRKIPFIHSFSRFHSTLPLSHSNAAFNAINNADSNIKGVLKAIGSVPNAIDSVLNAIR